MSIQGFTGPGYVGNFTTLSELSTRYPANLYSGRFADVSDANLSIKYVSDGTAWQVLGNKVVAKGRVSQAGHSFQSNGYVAGQVTSLNDLAFAGAFLPVPLDIVNNYGVAGSTIAGVISGQLPTLLTDGVPMVHMIIGTNDVADNAATAADLESWKTQVNTLAAALSPVKQAILWEGIDVAAVSNVARQADIRNYNLATAQILAKYKNIVYVPMDTALQDPAASPFSQTLLASQTFDGVVHPNTSGAFRKGILLANAIRQNMIVLPGYNVVRTITGLPFGTSGGTATPNSGTITQTNPIPAGYTVLLGSGSAFLTCVVTTVNPTGGPKRVRLTITATGAGAGQFLTNSSFLGAINTGDLMRGTMQYSILSQTGLLEASHIINRNGQLVACNSYTSAIETPTAGWPTEANCGVWRTPPRVATGSSNTFALQFTFRFGGAGSAVIEIYEGCKLDAVTET